MYKIWSIWTKERDAVPRIETVFGGKHKPPFYLLFKFFADFRIGPVNDFLLNHFQRLQRIMEAKIYRNVSGPHRYL